MKREILTYPNPKLLLKSTSVLQVNEDVRHLIQDMFETMYQANGIGLAAPQIGIQQRIIVMDLQAGKKEAFAFINPVIISREGEQENEEGCLSVPGIQVNIKRASKISMQALNREGKSIEIHAEGLLADCILHEIEHLDGILITKYLSRLQQNRLLAKIEKTKKLENRQGK